MFWKRLNLQGAKGIDQWLPKIKGMVKIDNKWPGVGVGK
jgi:hypothetical protein